MSETKNVFTPLRITSSSHPVSQRHYMFYLRLHHHSLPLATLVKRVVGFALWSITPEGTLAKAHV